MIYNHGIGKSSNDSRPPFRLREGIEVQEDHLKQWAMVLRPEVMTLLRAEAIRENFALTVTEDDPKGGYEVWRGCSMDNFVNNLAAQLYHAQKPGYTYHHE